MVDLTGCQEQIGYYFRNPDLLKTALTHKTAAATILESNERMEFLGDSFLGLVITDRLYHQYPGSQEGELSVIKGNAVSRKSCTKIARRHHLDQYLLCGREIQPIPDSLLANVVEALIAAVYLDGGVDTARAFVERLFSDAVQEAAESAEGANFKSVLQTETSRRYHGEIPQYILLDEQGPPHNRCFKVQARVRECVYRAAWAGSKKEAEQKAAENALCQMRGENPPWPDGDS